MGNEDCRFDKSAVAILHHGPGAKRLVLDQLDIKKPGCRMSSAKQDSEFLQVPSQSRCPALMERIYKVSFSGDW